jgi:aminoglycoside phosphotransferase (APT) family kinase protein
VSRLTPEELADKLTAFLKRSHDAESVRIDNLRLLTGGASRQTWSFDATVEHADDRTETFPLVLRSEARKGVNSMPDGLEYTLLEAAHSEGVPVPEMHLLGDDSLGMPFFLMERIEGETIARRLLRDDKYETARSEMTGQLAEALAAIHRVPLDKYDLGALASPLEGKPAAESELDRFEQTYRAVTLDPHPAFELAFRWLRRNLPPPHEPRLTHGDFRIGNVIFGPEGLRSVIDWELAHVCDPMEDLAWVCVRAWRFRNDHLPVGGIGTREDLWKAYEAAGGDPVDPEAARWWEVYGNLRWGIMTIIQSRGFLDETSRKRLSPGAQVELAAIGRRTSETEWELLNLIEPS